MFDILLFELFFLCRLLNDVITSVKLLGTIDHIMLTGNKKEVNTTVFGSVGTRKPGEAQFTIGCVVPHL